MRHLQSAGPGLRPSGGPGPSWLSAALAAGTVASAVSLVALLVHSHRTRDTPWQLVNAPSHWVHGQTALRQRRWSSKFTLLGMAIHHVSSLWWAAVYARLCGVRAGPCRPRPGFAALVGVGAWVVDTWLVPRRLTPGFERQATASGLWAIYGSFALGLWLGHACHGCASSHPASVPSATRSAAAARTRSRS